MNSSTRNEYSAWLQTCMRRGLRRRATTKTEPECELLDSRQLLSTLTAAPVSDLVPQATAVTNDTAILNNLDPSALSKLESALARAEEHSHVTLAQAGKLAQNEAAIDNLINSADLDANTTSTDLNQVQSDIDNAFLEASSPPATWAQKHMKLEQDVPDSPGSSQLISRTINQMRVVARAAGVTPSSNVAIGQDWAVLASDLGPTPDTSPGTGSADRDPLDVYFNGQVNNFIK
jgi:hypothetical protein